MSGWIIKTAISLALRIGYTCIAYQLKSLIVLYLMIERGIHHISVCHFTQQTLGIVVGSAKWPLTTVVYP